MEKVFADIVNRNAEPTRTDIAKLLAAVGKPGEKRGEKEDAVRRLFDETGHRPTGHGGVHIVETLNSYEAY